MATTQTKNGAPSLDQTFDQVKQFNDQFAKAVRAAGTAYVDSYEKAIDQTIELELNIAEKANQEWLKNLIEAQAEVTRELANSYTTAARSLLK
jgi:DNA-binding ferritin-like protein